MTPDEFALRQQNNFSHCDIFVKFIFFNVSYFMHIKLGKRPFSPVDLPLMLWHMTVHRGSAQMLHVSLGPVSVELSISTLCNVPAW